MNSCPVCGNPCVRTYCSQLCHSKTRRQHLEAPCKNCGKLFYSHDFARGGGIFCSVPCRREYKATNSVNYLKVGKRAVHRMIAEQKLGRKLLPGEVVHHANGNILDNRPENLEIFVSQSHHLKHEFATGRLRMSHATAVANGVKSGISRAEKGRLPKA